MPPRRRAPRKKAPARRRAPARKRAPRARRARMAVPGKLIISQPGSQTQSLFTHGSGKVRLRKGMDAMGVPSYYVFNKSYTIQPVAGTQGVSSVGIWNSVPDMNNMSSEVQVCANHPIAADTPVRFCVRSVKAEVMFTNSTNVGCVMDIYDIQCKRDTPLKAITGVPYDVSDPVSAWILGSANQETATLPAGYTSGAYFPGALPQDSQLFKDYYKVISKKSIALGAGASHQHAVHLKHPRLLDVNESGVETSYLVGVKGFTFFTMVVIRGQVASSAGAGGGNPSQNSTVLVRAVATERYEYQWVAINGSLQTYSSTLPAPGTAGVAMVDGSYNTASVITT